MKILYHTLNKFRFSINRGHTHCGYHSTYGVPRNRTSLFPSTLSGQARNQKIPNMGQKENSQNMPMIGKIKPPRIGRRVERVDEK